ncbi:histidine kinase [Saccharomonospora sp. CUA-673]|uniref:GAF and ANTAR domain-containing protein n=1 Tax=Saccharomonospora sp. CUA-673 TaxID=1904969 RepID=UPI0009690114|nr:GAF and ANTAR domain-containing protein [Saccharomonospora sp. CUA-673]OLT48973.1 histidine kinase [Saccharomonospora sp. CUA-673]
MNRPSTGAQGAAPQPDGPVEVAEHFTTFTRSLLASENVSEVLERVVDACWRVIPGAELVSVTLRDPQGEFFTPVETDQLATEIDRLQYRFDEGPCLSAADPDGPALAASNDLSRDPQWPRFGPAASELGVVSLLATSLLPTHRPPQITGALNIYAKKPAAFGPGTADSALLLATHASLALAHTDAVTRAALEREQLRRAIGSRDVIGQAKGILMERRGLSADEAFDVLRTTSQQLNMKVAELAQQLTDGHTPGLAEE